MRGMSNGVGDEGGGEVTLQPLGEDTHFISGNINFNAQTEFAHTELDVVYTLISVPHQTGCTDTLFLFESLSHRNL
eukprot:2965121-Ditylum_brightwellii.AAC.1